MVSSLLKQGTITGVEAYNNNAQFIDQYYFSTKHKSAGAIAHKGVEKRGEDFKKLYPLDKLTDSI